MRLGGAPNMHGPEEPPPLARESGRAAGAWEQKTREGQQKKWGARIAGSHSSSKMVGLLRMLGARDECILMQKQKRDMLKWV